MAKDEFIKVRVSKEDKKIIKEASETPNQSITKIINIDNAVKKAKKILKDIEALK